jgi:outer membrane biosynthesis protein TonB
MLKKITIGVVTLHLMFLFPLFFSPVPSKKMHARPLVVRTEKFQPKTRSTSTAAPSSSQQRPKPVAPVSKKPSKKPAVAEQGKPKSPPKKPAIPREESPQPAAKIEPKAKNVYPSLQLDVPAKMGALAIDHPETATYQDWIRSDSDVIIAYLHESLHLPEYGEVKIQLTVREDGSVAKLDVLKAESAKNKAYLEQNLPLLKFPVLERKEQTFLLTFCNE